MGRHLRTGVRLSSSPPDKEVLLHTYCAAAPFFISDNRDAVVRRNVL